MKICLTTYYDESYQTLGDMCWSSIKKYAARYGYSCERFQAIESDRPKPWNKILVISKLFDRGYDYVFWLDADALFVRFDRDISSEIEEGKDLYLVKHYRLGGEVPNTGVMLIRNCQESRDLLQKMWDCKHHLNCYWWENAAFIEVAGLAGLVPESRRFMFSPEILSQSPDPAIKRKIKWLSVRWNHTPVSPPISDFIIRHYAGASHQERLEGMAGEIRKTSLFYYFKESLINRFRKKIKHLWPLRHSGVRHKLRRMGKVLQKKKKPRVLFDLRRAGIGNMIEATPAIKALKQLYPDSAMDLWTSPKELLTPGPGAPDIHHIYSTEEIPPDLDHYDLRFNLTYDLAQSNRVLGNAIWIKPPLDQSEEDYYLDRIRWLGYKGPKPAYYAAVKPVDLDFPPERLKIAIVNCGKEENMGLRGESKRWPYYNQLIHQLMEKAQVQIYLIGSARDEYLLTVASDRVIDCRGKYSLPQTAFILKQCDLAIGNDCGPMRMANAVGTKCYILWGPTSEIKNAYQGDYVSIFNPNLDCRPCQGAGRDQECQSQECLYGLYPNDVLCKIEEIESYSYELLTR
ncbi:MAG: hypothetical protein HYZ83_00220 [Candidatus Omnitrophica bacterium]|nr:hypothetical protein [Candidatus Omnitrophota bacterium]